MTALMTVGIIVPALGLPLLLRARVHFVYAQEGLSLTVGTRLIRITLIPGRKKKKAQEKTPASKPKPKDGAEKRGGAASELLPYIRAVTETLERFRRHLSIDSLTVRYVSAADDPFDAAMNFGRVSAAAGVLDPLLHTALKVKRRSIETAVSFDGGGDTVFVDLTCSLAVYEIIYIALGIAPTFVGRKRSPGDGKAEQNG